MTRGMCECRHVWSNHRKIEGCLGEPIRPYKFEKRCECMRFRQKVEEEKCGEIDHFSSDQLNMKI